MSVQIIPESGSAQYLTPAPFVSLSKSYVKDDSGNILRTVYSISLTGTIVNVGSSKDSPSASGTSYNMSIDENIYAQDYIRTVFGTKNKVQLKIYSPDTGSLLMHAYCVVDQLDISPSTWTYRSDYSVKLTASKLSTDPSAEPDLGLQSASEDWSYAHNENGTVALTHSISAIGAYTYSSGTSLHPSEVARQWCRSKMTSCTSGVLGTPSSGSLTSIGLNDTSGYWNRRATEGFGRTAGSWSINEEYVYLPSGNAYSEYTANVNITDNKASISVGGTVVGMANNLADYDTRSGNAVSFFYASVEPYIFSYASGLVPSGFTLNPSVISKTLTRTNAAGQFAYEYQYGAISGALISGAIDESIEIVDEGGADVYAQIPVPGRAQGPVVQYMNTKQRPKRSLSIALVMAASSGSSLTDKYLNKPNTSSIVQALVPSTGYYYIDGDTESWNPFTRQYSRNISWTIVHSSAVSGTPSGIHNVQT